MTTIDGCFRKPLRIEYVIQNDNILQNMGQRLDQEINGTKTNTCIKEDRKQDKMFYKKSDKIKFNRKCKLLLKNEKKKTHSVVETAAYALFTGFCL